MGFRDKVRAVLVRGAAGLAVALAVSATAFVGAWQEYGTYWHYYYPTEKTQSDLDAIWEEIAGFRAVNGRLPDTLLELERVKAKERRVDIAGLPIDYWGNPYQYEVKGDDYSLSSYGRDGRAGGVGLDADIVPGTPGGRGNAPTLWQFAFEMPTGGMMAACLLAGVLAGLVWVVAVQEPVEVGKTWPRLLAALAAMTVTFIVSLLAALFMSALHLPSGH
jgi:hypothetical protein